MNDKITNLTAQLIEIPSISADHEACKHALDFAEGLFSGTSYKRERFEHRGVHSVIISKSGSRRFDLLYLGHLDVVPGPENIFNPQIKDGRIYGRGSADMKGCVAAMIQLFLDNEHSAWTETAALVLTTDEEVGGDNGIGYLTTQENLKADTVFNPDGGGIYAPAVSQKGIYQCKLSAQGASAHGSRPWNGDSAIAKLLEAIDAIKDELHLVSSQDTTKSSVNFGAIHAGESVNSVPESGYALLDIRYPAPLRLKDVREKVQRLAARCTVEELTVGEPVFIGKDNRSLQILTSILKERGHEAPYISNNTGSDARWFTEQGSAILLILPDSTQGHIDGEYASLEGLHELYEIMNEFALQHFI